MTSAAVLSAMLESLFAPRDWVRRSSCCSGEYSCVRTAVKLVVASILAYHLFVDVDSDLFRDTPDFIRKYGYPVESHTVISEDGYLLTLHRIPRGPKNDGAGKRPVVFLQHGIMCSSDIWVYSGPETDLAFILADNGFDVWLGNARGNHYANKHVNLSVNDEEYWDFSWHEMGYYDLPAVVDYILNSTHQKDLTYIGHSMGSTMFLVMASEKPEYNKKINFMVGLGPVGTLQHFTTLTQNLLVPAYLSYGKMMKLINNYQLLPRSRLRTYLTNFICKNKMPTQFLCRELAFGLAGESYEQYNSTAISVILSHVPAGSSEYQVLHFYQNMKKGKFQQRDFGPAENLKRYNQSEPPSYDLRKISAPVSLYYSDNDMMATVKLVGNHNNGFLTAASAYAAANSITIAAKHGGSHHLENVGYFSDPGVTDLANSLPNLVGLHKVPLKSFNHFDFTWGLDANRLLYDSVLSELINRTTIRGSTHG